MSGTYPSESKLPWNCLSCRRRKIRCDRRQPSCFSCVKSQCNCVYPTSGRLCRRAELQPPGSKAQSGRGELLVRLKHLEDAVNRLNSVMENWNQQDQISPRLEPSFPNNVSSPGTDTGGHDRVDEGFSSSESRSTRASATVANLGSGARNSIYIGDDFWCTLCQKVTIVRQAFAEIEGQRPDTACGRIVQVSGSSYPSFIFAHDARNNIEMTLKELRPSSYHMFFIWQTFLDNVSPFVHILHAPTVHKTLEDCCYNLEELDPCQESLFFAISVVAVNSLSAEEIKKEFGQDKEQCLAQLRFGTEQALARADFINTTSILIVQALTFYLIYIRRDQSTRYAWTLGGLLIRIALSIGLHRDGSHFPSISPFEVENRRRLWWHVLCFDERLSDGQTPGFGIKELEFDTLPPTNVNDDDLDPAMTVPPTARQGYTDTSLTLIRYDIWNFVQKMRSIKSDVRSGRLDPETGAYHMTQLLQESESEVHYRFGIHPDESVQTTFSILSRLNCNVWRLIIMHMGPPPLRDWYDNSIDAESFATAVSILKDVCLLQHADDGHKISWFLQGHVYWQPYAIVLGRICSQSWDNAAEDAWNLVTGSLCNISEAVQADPLWQPLRILLNKAYRHRIRALELRSLVSQTNQGEGHISLWSFTNTDISAEYPCQRDVSQTTGIPFRQRAPEGAFDVGEGCICYLPLPHWMITPITDSERDNMKGSLEITHGNGIMDGFMDTFDTTDWNEFLWSGLPLLLEELF